jgi:hypothetical protein
MPCTEESFTDFISLILFEIKQTMLSSIILAASISHTKAMEMISDLLTITTFLIGLDTYFL